jgi:hypothetical protein
MNIKFIAWDIQDSIMLKGSSVVIGSNDDAYFLDGDGEWKDCGDRVKLMLYSGITDKNKEEIYTDFIVKRTSMTPGGIDFVGLVTFAEGRFWIDNGQQAVPLFSEADELDILGHRYEESEKVEKWLGL